VSLLSKIGEIFKEILDISTEVATDVEPLIIVLDPAVASLYEGAVAVATTVEGQLKLIPAATKPASVKV
jgi:hypothetical protein